tara:strand:+ start:738 stop:1490 length:753 start_codon:yes stop_codon:yes gene_type:complete
MPVNDKLKKFGINRTTKKFVGQSPVERVVKETIDKTPIKRLSEAEQYKKELESISKRAQLIKATEDELERMEEERKHKKKVDLINKTLATPFSQGKEVDFEPVKQKMVEEYLPKISIPEQMDYPEPFETEPALNRELAEFKRKINEHLHQVGFIGSGGGGAEKLADLQDVDSSAQVNGRFLKYEASSGKFIGDAGPQPDNFLLEDGTGSLVLDTSDDAGDNILYEDGTGDFLLVLASHGIELKDHFTFSS